MPILKGLKRIFSRPFRSYLLENKYRVIPAFELGGEKFYMFDSQMEVPTGRQFAALTIYAEMECRMDREFMVAFSDGLEKILDDPKKIKISAIAQMNIYLKERLSLMVPNEFVYRLASVVFFTKDESPYLYDFDYNKKKINRWKRDGATLDFFLKTPLVELIPFLKSQNGVSLTYSELTDQVVKTHQDFLTGLLSEKA